MTNFEKNLIKVQRRNPVCEWWGRNGYKVWRVVLFPVWAVIWSKNKIEEKRYNALKWDDERATTILDKTLPSLLDKDEDGTLWYFSDWRPYFYNRRGIHGKNKRFAYKYNATICEFLFEKYQIEGYEKTIEKVTYNVCAIKFRKRD